MLYLWSTYSQYRLIDVVHVPVLNCESWYFNVHIRNTIITHGSCPKKIFISVSPFNIPHNKTMMVHSLPFNNNNIISKNTVLVSRAT